MNSVGVLLLTIGTLLLATCPISTEGAKILAIFPVQAKSHWIMGSTLTKELAKRGHEVTMISHYPEKNPIANYTDIYVKTTMMDVDKSKGNPNKFFEEDNTGVVRKIRSAIDFLFRVNQATCDLMLQEEGVKKLIHDRDAQFDLVILEPFNECFLGFVHKFKAPLVQVNTFAGMHFMGDWLGNPHPYSYVPDIFLGGSDRMDFIERLLNTISGTIWRIARHYLYLPGQDAVMKKHFGFLEGLPDASDIEYSTSILLLNHHFSIGYPRPLMPSMIQVGGLHVQEPKKLPQDLQSFMDDAPNGVIYFSLGSNLQSSVMPIPQRDALLKAFSQLKQKVLWKWETDTLPGQPKNVKLGKWLPQADILAHPNLRIFITHGGLLSTQEALNRGVPVIGIPLFADQDENMKKAELSGYGIIVSFRTLTTESISSAIKEVLENPSYRENAKRISKRYTDQPLTPLQTAVYWVEYVIRHNGARHLRSAVLDLKWHEYFLLDVIAVLAIAAGIIFLITFLIIRACFRICCGKKPVDKAKQAALYLFLALLFAANLRETEEAKILAFFPLQGKSHKIFTTSFAKELAKRGHELTVVNPFPEEEKIPNYKVIPLGQTTIQEMLKNAGLDADKDLNPFDMMNNNYIQSLFMLWGMGTFICDYALAYETMQNLMKSNEKYDLILLEYFYSDCFYGFAHKFKAPVIQMCAFAGTEVLGDLVGNPSPYAYVPDPFTAFTDKMGFTERLLNTVGQLFQKLGTEYYFLPKQDKVMRKHFKDPNMPYIGELQKSTALVLINHHFSLSYPRPMVPNFVQVGGMHVKPPKKLPADLQKFMDEATDGVVLFSMGSNLKSTDMPKETVQALVQGFGALKQKVLWKWEDDALPGQPKNLKIQKWLPQSDILAHPNLRLFITHGGLLSTQETINRGVPVVGIPIFGDQRLNMAKCESMGFGIKLEYKNITKESIVWAAKEVLDNPKYRENAQRLSRIFRDQPLTPLDQAIFWTEYVIRHKGAPHMRSAALDLTWYQYYLIDVIAVLAIAAGIVLLIPLLILRALCRKFFGGSKAKSQVSNKKKKN